MNQNITENLCRAYSLELMGCFIEEVVKINGLERIELIKLTQNFLLNENSAETSLLLAEESNKQIYESMKVQLDTLLENKKSQLKKVLDIENLPALFK